MYLDSSKIYISSMTLTNHINLNVLSIKSVKDFDEKTRQKETLKTPKKF